jgi:hypothetical protein
MTTEKKFDYKKPFQTRNGCKTELLADDLSGAYPLLVKIFYGDGLVGFNTYTKKGSLYRLEDLDELDLINISQKTTKWLNIYLEGNNYYSFLYDTKKEADNSNYIELGVCITRIARIACIKIEFEEGEGLEK